MLFCFIFSRNLLSSFWTSRGHRCRPFSPPALVFNFIAHRVQQVHCSSVLHRVLLTHALALPANKFVHKKTFPRIYTSTHSGGFELTKLTYTRLEDNLIRHRGDRLKYTVWSLCCRSHCRLNEVNACRSSRCTVIVNILSMLVTSPQEDIDHVVVVKGEGF